MSTPNHPTDERDDLARVIQMISHAVAEVRAEEPEGHPKADTVQPIVGVLACDLEAVLSALAVLREELRIARCQFTKEELAESAKEYAAAEAGPLSEGLIEEITAAVAHPVKTIRALREENTIAAQKGYADGEADAAEEANALRSQVAALKEENRMVSDRMGWTVEDNAKKAVELEDLRAKLQAMTEERDEARRQIESVEAIVPNYHEDHGLYENVAVALEQLESAEARCAELEKAKASMSHALEAVDEADNGEGQPGFSHDEDVCGYEDSPLSMWCVTCIARAALAPEENTDTETTKEN